MSEHMRKSIDDLLQNLKKELAQAVETKKAINALRSTLGEVPLFQDVVPEDISGKPHIPRDKFYGKPLAAAVRECLTMFGEASTIDEIYEALVDGGFEYNASDSNLHRRGLKISLAKNTQTFTHIKSSDSFGLREWYPGKAKERPITKEKIEEVEEPAEGDEPKAVVEESD